MKTIATGYYDAVHKLGLNTDHFLYKEFLKEIENIYIDKSHNSRHERDISFSSLSDKQRKDLLSLLVKADPRYHDFITEQENNLSASLIHALSNKISESEFFYYLYTCLCDHYQDEIDRAFGRASFIARDRENWENRSAPNRNILTPALAV